MTKLFILLKHFHEPIFDGIGCWLDVFQNNSGWDEEYRISSFWNDLDFFRKKNYDEDFF